MVVDIIVRFLTVLFYIMLLTNKLNSIVFCLLLNTVQWHQHKIHSGPLDHRWLISFNPLRMMKLNMNQSLHNHSPEWPPDSTGRRTHHSRRIWVSQVRHTAAWSTGCSGADCLVAWGEQSQSLWFLSRSSRSRLWRAGSAKWHKKRTVVTSFAAAKQAH